MKKSLLIWISCLLSLIFIFNLLSADTLPGTGINPEKVAGQVENVTNSINTPGGVNKQWEYIGGELQKMFLANPIARAIDSFLQKISVVFFVFFGIQYILSPALLFTIALWLFFFFSFKTIFKNFASFSKWVSVIIAFLLVVIMAHIKLFEVQVNFIMSLLFGNNSWILKLIFWLVIIFAPVFIYYFLRTFGKQFAARKKKMKDDLNSMKLEAEVKSGESISKAMEKIGKHPGGSYKGEI